MLSYQDVMTVRLEPLTTAAKDWDEVADGFEELETLYRHKVESVANDGVWVGVSAGAASGRFSATRAEFEAGQTEARALASILRDAHQQFTTLVKHVRDLTKDAKTKDFTIDAEGLAHYNFDKLTPYRNDPDYDKAVQDARKAEEDWTRSIKQGVQAVDDADQGVKLALHDAAGIKGFFEGMFDRALGRGDGFNANAEGDIEVVEAREANKYANLILAGEELDKGELAEYERLMRDNDGDKAFSQTMLNSLGPENTLKLSNKVNDLAYFDDTQDKRAYLNINAGLSNSLATATRVPEFKEADGKPLRYGTPAYQEAFSNWKKTPNSDFYLKWREELNELGNDKYDLKVAGEKVDVGRGHGQEIRGYQSLATLMQQGSGDFSPQFVADVTDDMIAMEKKDPDIWDLHGEYSGKNDGWFANDPVDASLGVMAHNPDGAAVYLDPATETGKERYEYLLGSGDGSRDWDIRDTTSFINDKAETAGPDEQDKDERRGLGDALTAAATGVDPTDPNARATEHTAANDRIFKHSLEFLSGQGDDMPSSLRDDMAKIMTSHGEEVHATMSNSGDPLPLDRGQVTEMTKQVSRSENSYGMLHEGMNYAILESFRDGSRQPEDTLDAAGYTVGFMEEARYNALKGDQHDYTWDKAWSYHASGAMLNFIPGVGDIAQRGADMVTTAWIMDEQQRQADELTDNNKTTYEARNGQLRTLANEWYAVNSAWAQDETGYSADEGIYRRIEAAANDGNDATDGIEGDQ
ncbi:hypothetical protein [Streptomyces mesophilus]|uniref:hypothetical protein n=1 Tax=Streptomyces mesophilus TaxID=1775132 RepID=UPI0033346A75